MRLSLLHKAQPWPWGCMHYSLYSLVGDERILENIAECSGGRFKLAMLELGIYLHPLFVDQVDSHTTPSEWWRKAINEDHICTAAGEETVAVPLLVDIDSPGYEGVKHCVGVAILGKPGLPVIVYDPGLPQQVEFGTLEQFAASAYGQCYHVYEVMDPVPDAFPSCLGPDQPHVRPETRERWLKQLQQDIREGRPVMIHKPIEPGRAAYARYGAVVGFKNFQGNPMPEFDELPPIIQQAWAAAAEKTDESFRTTDEIVKNRRF